MEILYDCTNCRVIFFRWICACSHGFILHRHACGSIFCRCRHRKHHCRHKRRQKYWKKFFHSHINSFIVCHYSVEFFLSFNIIPNRLKKFYFYSACGKQPAVPPAYSPHGNHLPAIFFKSIPDFSLNYLQIFPFIIYDGKISSFVACFLLNS